MELLNPEKHISCFNYDDGNEQTIEYMEIKKGTTYNFVRSVSEILLIVKGKFRFSYGKLIDEHVGEGDICLVPSRNKYSAYIEEDVIMFVFRINDKIDFCDHFSLESLYNEKQKNKIQYRNGYTHLKINERLQSFLDLLKDCYQDGLKCGYYFNLKQRELFYLLIAYYPQEELLSFFNPILSNDIIFSNLIYEHYDDTKSIEELAGSMNYSVSGFKKKFKRVFGISVNQWMNKERAHKIYHDINCSRDTFNEIALEYGFNSPSHFNKFCKKYFGASPSDIRKGYEVVK